MEEVEQIVIEAKSVLPAFELHWFENELRELLKDESLVPGWHERSIRIFGPLLDCDYLTRRLFRFFQLHRRRINRDLDFLESAYLHLDGGTYRPFFAKMLEFAILVNNRVKRLSVGYQLLEIVRDGENIHRSECEILGTDFSFRPYEKFRFLFEIYLIFDYPRNEQLLNILYEYKSRGSPNNEYEIQRLRYVGLEFFGSNECQTHRLLNFCTGDSVESDLVTPIGLNHPLSSFQWNNPIPVSTSTVGQGIRHIRYPNPTSPTIPVRNNYPVQCSSTAGIPIPVLGRYNSPFPDFFSRKTDSATSVGHGHLVQGIRILEHSTPVSGVTVRYNYPVHHDWTRDNLYEKYYPLHDLWTQGYKLPMTPVEPSYLVQDPRTLKHSSTIGLSSSAFDYLGPLVTADADLNNGTVPINQLLGPAKPVETSRATMEAPICVSTESLRNGGVIPLARTEHWNTQDNKMVFREPLKERNRLVTNLDLEKKRVDRDVNIKEKRKLSVSDDTGKIVKKIKKKCTTDLQRVEIGSVIQ